MDRRKNRSMPLLATYNTGTKFLRGNLVPKITTPGTLFLQSLPFDFTATSLDSASKWGATNTVGWSSRRVRHRRPLANPAVIVVLVANRLRRWCRQVQRLLLLI